jgi:hypothetical protein
VVGDGVGEEVDGVPEQERDRRHQGRGHGGGDRPPGAATVEAAAPDLGGQPDAEQHHHRRDQQLDRQRAPEGEPGHDHPAAGQGDRGHGHPGHQQDVVHPLPQVGEQQRVEADGQGHAQVPALAQAPGTQPQPKGQVDQQVEHARVGVAADRPQRDLDRGQQPQRPRPVRVVVGQRVGRRPPLDVDPPPGQDLGVRRLVGVAALEQDPDRLVAGQHAAVVGQPHVAALGRLHVPGRRDHPEQHQHQGEAGQPQPPPGRPADQHQPVGPGHPGQQRHRHGQPPVQPPPGQRGRAHHELHQPRVGQDPRAGPGPGRRAGGGHVTGLPRA